MNDYDKGLVQETFRYLQDKLDPANAVHTLNKTKSVNKDWPNGGRIC